jgi:hypothetical protein
MYNESEIRRYIVKYGITRKEAIEFISFIRGKDELSRATKANIPTFYSDALKQNVTVPDESNGR